MKTGLLLATAALCLGLAGCGGHKILKEPEPITAVNPLAAAGDEEVGAVLNWVIVRDGPGTWSRDADWDEYTISFANVTDEPIEIREVVVYDSMNERVEAQSDRKELVRASKQAARRYEDQGVEVRAGAGAGRLAVAGVAIGAVAWTSGSALALVGASSAAAAGAVLAGLLAAPLLVVGGFVKANNTGKVADEIERRHTQLPVAVAPGTAQQVVQFYPLTPSPRSIEIIYRDAEGKKQLVIDTGQVLDGLHLRPDE